MKKIAVILLMACLFLAACVVQKPVETPAPAETPTETPVQQPEAQPEVPVEAPAAQPPSPVETPAETPVEAPVEAPVEKPAESTTQLITIAKGDKVDYKGKPILIDYIGDYGLTVDLFVDKTYLHLKNMRSPEILNGIEYEIVENMFFKKNNTVTLSIKPLVLGKDEYFVRMQESAVVNGTKVQLNGVKQDSSSKDISAYVQIASLLSKEEWVKLGDTVTIGGFDITLVRAFWNTGQYAVLKIVQE